MPAGEPSPLQSSTHRKAIGLALLSFCAWTPLAGPVQAGPSGKGTAASSVAEREVARRTVLMNQARALVAEASALEAKGDHAEAATRYREAWNLLPVAPMAAALREEAKEGYSRTAVGHARKLADEARYPDARALLKTVLAADFNPGYAPAKKLEQQLDDPDRYEPALTPQHLANVSKVEKELRMGESFLNLGDYDSAIRRFQEVLLVDQYNKAARRGMERAEQFKADYYEAARDQTRAKRLTEVDKQWEDGVPVDDLSKLFGGVSVQMGAVGGGRESTLIKLRTLIVPVLDLQGAGLEEVIEFLRIRSRELDPQKKGIDFVLKVPPATAQKPVSLSMQGVPLEEVLRYATEMTGTVYRLDDYAVTITSAAERSDTLISKTYRVPPDFLQNAPTPGGPGAPPPNPFAPQAPGGTPDGGLTLRRMGVKEFLEQRGVQFPPGSSAGYNPSTNMLSVRNTEENLVLIDTLVDELSSATPKQVEIQVRMVEVNEVRFRELGFDWLLGQFNLPGTERAFASGGTIGNQQTSSPGLENFPFVNPGVGAPPIGTYPVTSGLRSSGAIYGMPSIDSLIGRVRTQALDSRSPGVFAVTGAFTDPQFQVVLRALSQSKGVDFMVSPTVMAKSGQRSRISVSREMRYPTEFDPPQVPQTLGFTQVTTIFPGAAPITQIFTPEVVPVTPATPTAFEMREVGVILEVEPVVGPDNRTVDLNLVPSLTEFEGFINYGQPITLAGANVPPNAIATPNEILQPIFRTNKVTTSVTVWDGNTVVLGGAMYEKRQDIDDKVPIIGNIPIVGRAFKSQLSNVEKKNVLFFVTVKVLDPGGNRVNPVATGEAAGATAAR